MKEKITLCGDNCLECPRYNAHTKEELRKTAELWYKVGWRNKVVSDEEISCSGCSSHKKCTYKLVECIKEQGVSKCSECNLFKCEKIKNMIKRSEEYKEKCRQICTPEEFEVLNKAFFQKENNLEKE